MKFQILYKDEPYTIECEGTFGNYSANTQCLQAFYRLDIYKNQTKKTWWGGTKDVFKFLGAGRINKEHYGSNRQDVKDKVVSVPEFLTSKNEEVSDMIKKIIETKDRELNKYHMLLDCSPEIESIYNEPNID